MKKLTLLLASSVAVLAISACAPEHKAASVTDMPPGTYQKTTSGKDASGAMVKKTNTTEVQVQDDGSKKAVVKSETTRDPKGLFNKSTSSHSTTVRQSNN